MAEHSNRNSVNRRVVVAGVASAAALAFLISPLASSLPDGLERVAELKGFARLGEALPSAFAKSPLPGYGIPGAGNNRLATGFAGLVGIAACLGLSWAVGLLLKSRGRRA